MRITLAALLCAAPAAAQFDTQPPLPQPSLTQPATAQPGIDVSSAGPKPLGSGTTGPLTAPYGSPGGNFSPQLPSYPFQQPGATFGPASPLPTPSTGVAQPPFQAAPLQPLTPSTTPQAPVTVPLPGGAAPAPVRKAKALRRLDEVNASVRRKLWREFAARKRKLLETEEWKLSSRSERKAMLKSLKEEFRAREERLRSSYLTNRQRILGRET